MTPVERLAVAFVRGMNARVIDPGTTDREVLERYRDSALPIAEALAAVVRGEVAGRVEEAVHDHWETWHQDRLD